MKISSVCRDVLSLNDIISPRNSFLRKSEYACPLRIQAYTLSQSAAQLPQIEIVAPPTAICTNTIDSMRSGTVFGTAAMLDGMVKRFESELGEKATVIVTGGIGGVIAGYCESEVIVDKRLLIDGLRIIYDKNKC